MSNHSNHDVLKSSPKIPIPKKILAECVISAQEWAATNGMIMTPKLDTTHASEAKRSPHAREIIVSHTPVTLIPSPFPRLEFKKAIAIQTSLQLLQHFVSLDHEFLFSSLGAASENDDFTRKLMSILSLCKEEGIAQKVSMGIFRSDYMLNRTAEGSLVIKQIEMNTISTAFVGLGPIVSRMHRFVCGRYGLDPSGNPTKSRGRRLSTEEGDGHLPINSTLANVVRGMAEAHFRYDSDESTGEAVVMMIVQPGERNPFDQRWIDFTLWENHKVKLIRRSLKYVAENGELRNGTERRLYVDDMEVSLCYFRAGYTPDDYPTDEEWNARTLIERSYSIKCPSIDVHLSGAKKIQQALAVPGAVEKYIKDVDASDAIRNVFAGLYSLDHTDDASVDKTIETALANPRGFVLKPQREGGGNNLYESEMCEALKSMSKSELKSYILMERIFPPHIENYIVRGIPR